MNLTEFRKLVTPKVIAANWTEAVSNRIAYLGESLFPSKQKAGLDLKWIKGSKGLPVSLMPSAFDVKATFRSREGIKLLETEMPFFREGFKIKEKDRQDILRIREKNDPYLTDALNRVFDDAGNLLDGALVVAEREIMQLLFAENGNVGISIQANGVDYTYNYDPQGGVGSILVMNKETFKLFRSIKAIKDLFLTTNGLAVGYLTDNQIITVLKDALGLTGIVVYDKQYKDEDGTTQKFVPDYYVAVIPDGQLGNTWRGTTPEEADLMGSGKADVAVVNNGIAITQILDEHPVNLNTFASEIVLPSYERMDEVALIKVK